MATSPTFIGTPKSFTASIVAADTTGLKTIVTAVAAGTRIEHLTINSTEASKTFIFSVVLSSVTTEIFRITPAVNVTVDVLAAMFPLVEKQFLVLMTGAVLRYNVTVAMTAANAGTVYADGGDY